MKRLLYWLGLVPVSRYEEAMRALADAISRAEALTNDKHSLCWHLGVPWRGLPPMRWRKLNEPPDDMMAAALARIDALKGAAK